MSGTYVRSAGNEVVPTTVQPTFRLKHTSAMGQFFLASRDGIGATSNCVLAPSIVPGESDQIRREVDKDWQLGIGELGAIPRGSQSNTGVPDWGSHSLFDLLQ